MKINERIELYVRNPFPIWNHDLTLCLKNSKLQNLNADQPGFNAANYSTSSIYLKKNLADPILEEIRKDIFLESPDLINLCDFYKKHGLEVLSSKESEKINGLIQLGEALDFLTQNSSCRDLIELLVQRVQVLRQPQPEFDISYSHPNIPFSIFVSVGEGNLKNDIVRLAESILHEALHLQLTLIENITTLIEDNSISYFSPWRGQKRPIRGVLHGMYVFKGILDFYESITPKLTNDQIFDFVDWRIEQIKEDFLLLSNFPSSRGLTANGATLAKNLLPLN